MIFSARASRPTTAVLAIWFELYWIHIILFMSAIRWHQDGTVRKIIGQNKFGTQDIAKVPSTDGIKTDTTIL